MNIVKAAGLTLIFVLWIWLAKAVLTSGGNVTLMKIFTVIASGIIVFVPLWKKFAPGAGNKE